MDWQTLAAGLGAVLTGAGGCTLVIHEFRRRDRAALKQEVDELSLDVSQLRGDLIACRRYAFDRMQELEMQGLPVPPWPELHNTEGGGE